MKKRDEQVFVMFIITIFPLMYQQTIIKTNLDAKSEDCDDHLKDECQRQLPESDDCIRTKRGANDLCYNL